VQLDLTVKDPLWMAVDSADEVVAMFREEADARAFVALPAKDEALKAARVFVKDFTSQADLLSMIDAALAQADGPQR
jgi:hypothetical protein